jgi:uncharacterized Zn finger protein (UPF0148 family)
MASSWEGREKRVSDGQPGFKKTGATGDSQCGTTVKKKKKKRKKKRKEKVREPLTGWYEDVRP